MAGASLPQVGGLEAQPQGGREWARGSWSVLPARLVEPPALVHRRRATVALLCGTHMGIRTADLLPPVSKPRVCASVSGASFFKCRHEGRAQPW